MKIRQLISDLRTIVKETFPDSVLTNRDIWGIAWAYALTYIQRATDQKRNIYNFNVFKVKNVYFREVPLVPELDTDCIIYKSIDKLPQIVESNFGLITKYITTLDGSKAYSIVNPKDFLSKLKITKGKGKFIYIEDGYVYSNDKYPLKISALFSNILELLKEDGGCKIMDLEAPIPEYMISNLMQVTPQQLNVFLQKQQDTTTTENPNN
jgi:hypothetical protein